ncbi:TGS domain protein [Ancylostoma ceylanicum]|uniref:TGS domain protein n=1 Tax=Ancylostoma ceylanicum TaxID=53326 RepID=A0A0D6M806_9BILA|nr:TGS domain protein [Ancylostoma ceylanicum]
MNVARTCSLILMVLDVMKPLKHKQLLEYELEGFGIRLNKQPPNIGFKKKEKGGINLTALVPQSELDLEAVKSILSEYKIHNADITLRYDATSEDLIDVIEGNRVYIPCIYVLNKIDQISIEELDIIYRIPHCVPISAHHKWNFDDLLEKIALVWGASAKHNPQRVGKEHVLFDEDVVQILKRRRGVRRVYLQGVSQFRLIRVQFSCVKESITGLEGSSDGGVNAFLK